MRYELYASSDSDCWGIDAIGYSGAEMTTRFGPGRRNNYIIHYVLSGQGYFNGVSVKKVRAF